MKRRGFLGGIALAVPNIARADETRILKFTPVADVTVLDPMFAGPEVTGLHASMVWDTLFALDSQFNPHPQMLEGYTVEDDGKTWRLTLRPGLRFHDGEPVLADDVVASLRKWGTIDVLGVKLFSLTDDLRALSDKVVQFRLKRPFGLLPVALAKPATYTPYIMPRRMAELAGTNKLTEMIGSGPFRYMANERVVGARVVYEKFAGYVPRQEKLDWLSGGKIAHFDRIQWTIIPDPSTAAASLQKGEIDWWGDVPADLGPLLRRDPKLVVQVQDFIGGEFIMRFNALHPPFDNPAIRRAILPAINQADFMTAVAGDERALWRDRVGVFSVGKPMSTDVGVEVMEGNLDKARRALIEAGYKGERIAFMASADYPSLFAVATVAADLLQRIGFNVDLQTTDYGTQTTRRANRQTPDKGGWSVFINQFNGFNRYDPAAHLGISSTWSGWPKIDEIEARREDWFNAPDLASRQAIAREIQRLVWRDVPYIPLGSYFPLTAYKRGLQGVQRGGSPMYNVRFG